MRKAMWAAAVLCLGVSDGASAQTAPVRAAPSASGASCAAPIAPVAPPASRPPSLAELNAFSAGLMRHQQGADSYLACLDTYLGQPRLTQQQRDRAIGEYNRLAPEIDRLWSAYDMASTRFREAAARNAKAAPPSMPALPGAPQPQQP